MILYKLDNVEYAHNYMTEVQVEANYLYICMLIVTGHTNRQLPMHPCRSTTNGPKNTCTCTAASIDYTSRMCDKK